MMEEREKTLQSLQRRIGSCLHFAEELRTYVVRGIFDMAMDRSHVKLLLGQPKSLVVRPSSANAKMKSLAYAILVGSCV